MFPPSKRSSELPSTRAVRASACSGSRRRRSCTRASCCPATTRSGSSRSESGWPPRTVALLLTELAPGGTADTREQVDIDFDRYHEILRPLFRGHGGHELQAQERMIQVAFGRPSEAIAAAVAGQRALGGIARHSS